jgi:hypothetical protein
MTPIQPILTALPTLAVATVYCFWHVYAMSLKQREQRLRARVTYMLWVMAKGTDDDP